jgi:hypothetical protein
MPARSGWRALSQWSATAAKPRGGAESGQKTSENPIIAGFALDGNKWDGLYLARRKGADLIYAGKVNHGFDKVSAADLREFAPSTSGHAVLKAFESVRRTGYSQLQRCFSRSIPQGVQGPPCFRLAAPSRSLHLPSPREYWRCVLSR